MVLYIDLFYIPNFSRLGFDSFFQDVIGEEKIKEEVLSDEDTSKPYNKNDDSELDSEGYYSMPSTDSSNYDIKLPNATDFFDIDEMAEDEVVLVGSI